MNEPAHPLTDDDPRTWWQRNRKWVIPVGILGFLLTIALMAMVLYLFISFLFGLMKSSGAYQEAVAIAVEDPRVIQAIGEPVEEGFFVTGNINTSGSSGSADIRIPLSGPRGEASLYVIANRHAGEWQFNTLVLETEENGQRIDLLEE